MFIVAFVFTSSPCAAAVLLGWLWDRNLHRETKCALPGHSQPHPGGHQPVESQEEHRARLAGENTNSGLQGTRVLPRFLPGLPQQSISPMVLGDESHGDVSSLDHYLGEGGLCQGRGDIL